MDIQIRELEQPAKRSVNKAAALAREQLLYAEAIAKEIRPGHYDSVLVGALLQAIATNYASVAAVG